MGVGLLVLSGFAVWEVECSVELHVPVVGQGGEKSEDNRRSEYYHNEWIADAVDRFLKKKSEQTMHLNIPDFLDPVRDV
ncbi:hypothetical protein AAMO2058_001371000 [Amorphochlora amoebiformis]